MIDLFMVVFDFEGRDCKGMFIFVWWGKYFLKVILFDFF